MKESEAMEYVRIARDWIASNDVLLAWAGILSAVMFFGTVAILGVVVVMLPGEYFMKNHREAPRQPIRDPLLWLLYLVAKNTVGVFLVIAGFAMLFLPGQGLLSMIIGLSLTSFPGKRRLIRYMISRKAVLESANWLRKKFDRPPFQVP